MADAAAELRKVMYQVIQKMIDDGELVPVYDGDKLVDIKVQTPSESIRNT